MVRNVALEQDFYKKNLKNIFQLKDKLVDGKVIRREDGKVQKPEGWTAPDIKGVLDKAHEKYNCKIASITL